MVAKKLGCNFAESIFLPNLFFCSRLASNRIVQTYRVFHQKELNFHRFYLDFMADENVHFLAKHPVTLIRL